MCVQLPPPAHLLSNTFLAPLQPQYHLESSAYDINQDNVGAKTVPWLMANPTDVWNYPKSAAGEGPRNPNTNAALSYNPQGYVYTHAGSTDGTSGDTDGVASAARFKNPEDVAVDNEGYTYVADTGNHKIKMIRPDGYTITLAGTGE